MKCEEHNIELDWSVVPEVCPRCLAESEARWAVAQATPSGAAKFHGGVFDGLKIATRVIPSMLQPFLLAQGPGGQQTKYKLWNVMEDGTAHYYPTVEV